jgi:hypothetical protein
MEDPASNCLPLLTCHGSTNLKLAEPWQVSRVKGNTPPSLKLPVSEEGLSQALTALKLLSR